MLANIKKDFTTRTLVLIPIAIAINIAIGELVVRLKLPIYLDSIGTVLVGAIAGPWAGASAHGAPRRAQGSVPANAAGGGRGCG